MYSPGKNNPMPEEGSFRKESLSTSLYRLYPSLNISSTRYHHLPYSSSSEDVEASSKSLSTLSFSKFSSSELVPSDPIG